VDLEEGFITVKTAKTGETVDIPLFPMLRDVLRAAEVAQAADGGQKSAFCFPEAAAMYEKNPDGITWRVKQVLAAAFRRCAADGGKAFPVLPDDEVKRRGLTYLDSLDATKRTGHMRQVFDLYTAGRNIVDVMNETGLSRGSVSGLLNDIEKHIECVLVRGKTRGSVAVLLQEERANGGRRASVHDFHSFRVTWITLALAAGVPLELVQRVTGHRTVEIVLKHYFRPGREDFRETIIASMPEFLTAPTVLPALLGPGGAVAAVAGTGGQSESVGAGDALEEALKALEAMNAKNWRKQRDVAAGLIRKTQ
jgi:hypothetical protein